MTNFKLSNKLHRTYMQKSKDKKSCFSVLVPIFIFLFMSLLWHLNGRIENKYMSQAKKKCLFPLQQAAKKMQLGGQKNFFLTIFKRLLWCFNPSSTLKNNCFLLVILTTERWLILLHCSITALWLKNRVMFYILVECFVFLILLVFVA